jgi:hypothetical protein
MYTHSDAHNSHINRDRVIVFFFFAFKVTNVQNAHHQHKIPNSFLQRLFTSVTFSVFQ